MNSIMLGLLAETSLHPGSDTTGGVVDLPVAREATTSYPVIMGSGLKGALRELFEEKRSKDQAQEIFGKAEAAGNISITDGRLLLLPVRSLSGSHRWVTCPYILERLQRDLHRIGLQPEIPQLAPGEAEAIVGPPAIQGLYLEELSFKAESRPEQIKSIVDAITPLIYHQSVQKRLLDQLVVVSDDDFSHFARYGLPVNARNVLNQDTKTSNNLWYEETIPADSVFYSILTERAGKPEQLSRLQEMINEVTYIQVGGNETIGQGWCAMTYQEGR